MLYVCVCVCVRERERERERERVLTSITGLVIKIFFMNGKPFRLPNADGGKGIPV